jgi:hypothetical protein
MPRATVITVSDSRARGEREDLSGPEACTLLREAGFDVGGPEVVPDGRLTIAAGLVSPEAQLAGGDAHCVTCAPTACCFRRVVMGRRRTSSREGYRWSWSAPAAVQRP